MKLFVLFLLAIVLFFIVLYFYHNQPLMEFHGHGGSEHAGNGHVGGHHQYYGGRSGGYVNDGYYPYWYNYYYAPWFVPTREEVVYYNYII